jgi:hypothetical protein
MSSSAGMEVGMTKLQVLALYSQVAREQVLNPNVAVGKLYAKALEEQHPDLHSRIQGDVTRDPYLSDDNVVAFMAFIAENTE